MECSIGDKPIIKTLIFDGNYYMYDTYTNNMYKISREHFMEIKKLQKMGIERYRNLSETGTYYKDVIMLLDKGLMRSAFVHEIQHPESDYVEVLLNRCINDVTLQVTRDCNFRCRYCLYACDNNMERSHEKEDMSWEIAKEAIDLLYKRSIDANEINIEFYGGEPLLNFPLIVDVVDYVEQIFFTKCIKFSMAINGSLLSDNIVDFLIQHNFKISISLDGSEIIQNRHRKFGNNGKGTFSVVYQNVLKIRNRDITYFDNNVTFQPVIMEGECLQDVRDFFDKLGIDGSKIIPLRANLSGIDYIVDITKQDDVRKKNEIYDDEMEQHTIKKLRTIFDNKSIISSKWHHNGQCIPGVQRVFIDTKGNFFPCEKITEDPTFSIGSLKGGFDLERIIEFLNVGKLTEDECKRCWAMRFCDMCISQCNDIDKKAITKEQKLITCNYQREKTLSFFRHYISDCSTKEFCNVE